jgi:hypothetical protein
VLAALTPIWSTKAETATRVRGNESPRPCQRSAPVC